MPRPAIAATSSVLFASNTVTRNVWAFRPPKLSTSSNSLPACNGPPLRVSTTSGRHRGILAGSARTAKTSSTVRATVTLCWMMNMAGLHLRHEPELAHELDLVVVDPVSGDAVPVDLLQV